MHIDSRTNGAGCVSLSRVLPAFAVTAAMFLLCLVGPDSARSAESPRARELLLPVIEAIKNAKADYGSGRGTAFVEDETNGEKERRLIEFRYKGRSTRSDVYYAQEEGKKGSLEVKYTVNNRNAATYMHPGEDAYLFGDPQAIFFRQLGLDMHPETFATYGEAALDQLLSGLLRAAERESVRLEANLDEQGILHVRAVESGSLPESDIPTRRECVLQVDTKDGWRWVSARESEANVEGVGSTMEKSRRVHWKKYGSRRYVESVEERKDETVVEDANGLPIPPEKRSHCVRVRVLKYEPDPDIKDEEFTFDGLHIPEGTKVIDHISGITYLYSGPGSHRSGPRSEH